MKKLLSLFLCLSMIFSIAGISTVKGTSDDYDYYYVGIEFVDENTFYIKKVNDDKDPDYAGSL